ncbi:GlsB/YeaQ/YmgE family stress response membrane protein [soil metagenome]
MINFILWIIFGALAGWIASMITKTNEQQGAIGNILTGIVGAFIGGFIVRTLTGNDVEGFNIASLAVAILGAVLLISLLKMLRRGKARV